MNRTKQKFLGTLWQKTILGIIGLIFALGTAYIKGCFNPTHAAKSNNISINKGSGSQYNAARDLIINNPPTQKKDTVASNTKNPKKRSKPKNNNTEKVNPNVVKNEGFINNGGIGNTYNQTLNKGSGQRHLSNSDLNLIITNVPKDYIVNLNCIMGDIEGENYAREIVETLKNVGYNSKFSSWFVGTTKTPGQILLIKNDSAKTVEVKVFSQPPLPQ